MSLRPAEDRPAPLDWVLVAHGALREVSDHVHPGSRMKGSEFRDERAGG